MEERTPHEPPPDRPSPTSDPAEQGHRGTRDLSPNVQKGVQRDDDGDELVGSDR